MLRLLPGVSLPLTILLAAGIISATVLPLTFTVVTGFLVGSIPAAVHGGFDSPAGRHTLTLLAAAALLIAVLRLIAPLQAALASTFGRRVDRQLQERTMAAVGRPGGIGHLEDPAVLDLIRSAQGIGTQDVRPGTAVTSLASLLPSWLQALGSALILATFRPWLGLTWLLIWPVILYYLQREFVRVGQAMRGQAAVLRRADYYRDLALTPGAAKEVRLWGLPGWLVDRYDAAWRSAIEPAWQARRPGRAVLWMTTAAVAALELGTFALLASAAVHRDIGLAALAVYTRAALDAGSFRAFDTENMNLAYAAIAVPSLLTLERRLVREDVPSRGSLPPDSPRVCIRFEGLSFRYASQTSDTISELSLEIPAGRSLAIVGANGAGKTTLVKLLCRLYEPTGGRISVDGVNLRDVDPADWRRHVAAIFQDFARYHLPASENVTMGAPALAAGLPGQSLVRAAGKAGALNLVEALPKGWDTILSRQYTDGADLSGGQWQRIALARALFAVEGGARVLILDEPTANLDVRAEAELYDRFLEITESLTTVLISHRFATVRRAHRIVVLEDGRVVESGTHDELMAMGGRYARMFELQAQRFTDGGA